MKYILACPDIEASVKAVLDETDKMELNYDYDEPLPPFEAPKPLRPKIPVV